MHEETTAGLTLELPARRLGQTSPPQQEEDEDIQIMRLGDSPTNDPGELIGTQGPWLDLLSND